MSSRVDVQRLLSALEIQAEEDGDEYKACCPFHQERTPSWSMNRATTTHYCFGCGRGGVASDLVCYVLGYETLGLGRGDAWNWMRAKGLVEGEGATSLSLELYLRLPERPGKFRCPSGVIVNEALERWPTPVRRYLEARRVMSWQVARWGLSYALSGRLEGRIVFPVRDTVGVLRSYTARSFTGSPRRYLTPDSSESPDLSALFGEQGWPERGERSRLVAVEGAIKALAVERATGDRVAGLLGVTQARNPRVLSKLSTFEEVVILFDPDEAGERAGNTLAEALARHVRVRKRQMRSAPIDDAPEAEVREVLS